MSEGVEMRVDACLINGISTVAVLSLSNNVLAHLKVKVVPGVEVPNLITTVVEAHL
jgi:hypothetical protein